MAHLEKADKKQTILIAEVEKGEIKIPQFQRQFVWDLKASAKLIDSVLKGYPIGTFIYWRTHERLRSIRNIGNINLPEPVEGEFVNYVLDGQQRITSLFAAFKGETITRADNREEDYSEMYIDLLVDRDQPIIILDVSGRDENTYIKVTDWLYGGSKLFSKYPEKLIDKLDEYKTIINSYDFPGINLREAEIDIATEVFTRLNVGGRPLTLFEIMAAKTYDVPRNFDLAEKYDELINNLAQVQYDTISSATVLQVVSMLIKKDVTRKTILKLDKNEFIDMWEPAIDTIKTTIDYFRVYYGVTVSKLLPYNALIVPFSYFFYNHKEKPTGVMQAYLQDFFWRCSIGIRYSAGVESKLAQDVEKIDTILNGNLPRYEWSVNCSAEYIKENGWFSTGRSFIKSILIIYAKNKPKSFDDNSDVTIDNSWLKIATSKNYHHFFPKAFMRNKRGENSDSVNHILNITIVDGYLNKNKIRAKAPSVYMKYFARRNHEIKFTMKSHFIDDLEKYGVWDDNYELFINSRAKRLSKELKKRIIMQDSDEEGLIQTNFWDYEENINE